MINSIGLLMNKLSPPKSLFSPRGYTLSVAHSSAIICICPLSQFSCKRIAQSISYTFNGQVRWQTVKQVLQINEPNLFQGTDTLFNCWINGKDSLKPADVKNFHYSFVETAKCQHLFDFLHLFGNNEKCS